MSDILDYLAPRLVVLLIVSPWIGVATTYLVRLSGGAAIWKSALFNAAMTAIFASALGAYVITRGTDFASGGEGFRAIRGVWAPLTPANSSFPWSVEFGFSIGVDSITWTVLLWIPWLTFAALQMLSERQAARPGFCAGLLALEGTLLLAFAAQDAITFCLASEGSIVLMWSLTGWYGTSERRTAAEMFFRWQHTAQLLWTFGLLAIAIAAVWVQQEIRRDANVVRFGWSDLSELLERYSSRYISSFEYWNAAAPILIVLVIAAIVRSGLIPCHNWLPVLLQETDTSAAVLQLGAAGLIGSYGYQRCLAPLITEGSWCAEWLLTLGAASALVGGLLCLAQTDLRKFVAYWWISLQGCLWLGLATLVPVAQKAGWWGLQSAAASAAGMLLVVQALERRYDTRDLSCFGGLAWKLPRLATAACVVMLLPIGLPATARGCFDFWWQIATLSATPGLWWLALAGWLCTSWATIWLVQRLFFGRLREIQPDPQLFSEGASTPPWTGASQWDTPAQPQVLVQDLSSRECFAISVTLVIPAVSWWSSLSWSMP